jgi:MFS superfamily sulfate permease-like transporter
MSVARDLTAGMVVFLVALPLCLGIALASDAPLFSGLVAGIVGGILVGLLSGSHTSVSGPAAGLTVIVAAQISALGSFDAFLLAVVIAGVIQIILGVVRAGFIAEYFPSAVIKGLLAAIGVLLILKQVPHIFGRDDAPLSELAFQQIDQETTFSELIRLFSGIHFGATAIGLTSVAVLMIWDRIGPLKRSIVPAPLVVVLLGVGMTMLFERLGLPWQIEVDHLVQVPVAESLPEFLGFLRFPDFSQWSNPAIYLAAFTIAAVASLETLLNLEAVDKLDPRQRKSPPSRELWAQGAGNVVAGMLGGIPITAVIIRGSVNIMAGAQSKLSAIFHGVLLIVCVAFLPASLNLIPLACLAAILLVTGFKLASWKLARQMWMAGRNQFIPFIVTVLGIVLTDLLVGIGIGLLASLAYILQSNLRRPIHLVREKHLSGDVFHVELANQVSFLNRAALSRVLSEVPPWGHILLDARGTDYIDPDILDMIRDYRSRTGPARGVTVSLIGFQEKYRFQDEIQFVDFSTRELQDALTPQQVLDIFREGHERYRSGQRLYRDLGRRGNGLVTQHPLAVILSCIDSRAPAELIFDVGVGDLCSVRVSANITSRKVLGSIEYACAIAGAKLVLVMGHTRCSAVMTSIELARSNEPIHVATGCQHVEYIVNDVRESIPPDMLQQFHDLSDSDRQFIANSVAERNVRRTVEKITKESETIAQLVQQGRVMIVGALYDVDSREITFVTENHVGSTKAME